jgi:HlyD family secretion protein
MIKLGDIQSSSTATALFKGIRDVTLSAESSGNISKILVTEGSRVKTGQLLVELDHVQQDAQLASTQAQLDAARTRLDVARSAVRPQELAQAEAGLSQAQAALDLADKNLKREQKLYASGVTARVVLDAAESQYKQAQAGYETAQQAVSLAKEGARSEDIKAAEATVRQLEAAVKQVADLRQKAFIKAPFAGKVTKVDPEEHEMLAAGMPVLGLVDNSTMELTIGVSSDVVTKIKQGQAVKVSVESLGRKFSGNVKAIGVKGDDVTGTFPVKINVTNKDESLLAGMTGEVELPLVAHKNVVILPRAAVLFQTKGAFVMVREGQVAKSREIKTGLESGTFIEITQGLKEGDEVIVVGMKNVFDGTAIKIVKTQELELPASAAKP